MYAVKLNAFEGPLDLLLYLIRKNEIDIYDIPIVQITGQYIEYINMMKMLDLDIAGEFLVMAATLLQMKSEAMLPTGAASEDDEEMMTREELVRQLLEYKKFKDAAQILSQQEEKRRNLFSRSFVDPGIEDFELKEFRIEATLFDLLSAFRNVLKAMPQERLSEFREETVTVQQKIRDIIILFKNRKRIDFISLFPSECSKLEIIVTFLAVLELIRTKQIIARQAQIFSRIWLYRRSKISEKPDPSSQQSSGDQSPVTSN
jgi:segregation and condensation protein A